MVDLNQLLRGRQDIPLKRRKVQQENVFLQNLVVEQHIGAQMQPLWANAAPQARAEPRPLEPQPMDGFLFEGGPDDDDEEEQQVRMRLPEKKVKARADYSSRTFSTKSTRLPAFRMAYQGADEMSLRLQGTIIQSHDTTLYVNRIEVVRCEFSNEVGMGAKCTFPDGSVRGVLFNPERTNLRSPDPGYIQLGNDCFYYNRRPARIYKQGINSENSCFVSPINGGFNIFGVHHIEDILTSFDERPIIQWQHVWPEGYIVYRLCDRIALTRYNGGKSVRAYYKGKYVGSIANRTLTLIPDIESDFWMSRAFASVGIQINAKG